MYFKCIIDVCNTKIKSWTNANIIFVDDNLSWLIVFLCATGDNTSGNENQPDDDDDGLSGGAVAGIVIGTIVGLIFVVLLAVGILYFIKYSQETGATTKAK